MSDLPVAAPDHTAALGALLALFDAIDRGRALLPNGALILEVDAGLNDGVLWKSDASMLLDEDDLAALHTIPVLLAERQQDKERIERLRAENSAMAVLYYAVERADRHGNLSLDLEDAFGRCESELAAALAVEEDARPGKPETPGNSRAAVEEDAHG